MSEVNRENAGAAPEAPKKNRIGKVVALGGVLLLAAAVLYWFFFLRGKESTDNAYVMADTATISARVPGTIQSVAVENDDFVKRGSVLLELDPADYRLRVKEAQAALTRIRAERKAARIHLDYLRRFTQAALQGARAALRAAEAHWRAARERWKEVQSKKQGILADYKHALKDWQRFQSLATAGAASVRDRDRMKTALRKAQAALAAIEATEGAAKAVMEAAAKDVETARAKVEEAEAGRLQVQVQEGRLKALDAQEKEVEARLEEARLQLSYCRITAPIDGYVAQKRIQVGNRVQPGQPLMAVVPLHQVYVEANFKETQVENIRIGQPAEIRADCYPGRLFKGRVVGIRSGTGAAFSLLPPENATGNWVKITQRVPVKIRLDDPFSPEFPLRLGFSLEVTVDTSDQSGPRLRRP